MTTKFRFWYEREDFYPDENFMSDVWKIEYVTDSIIYFNDSFTFNPYTNVAGSSYAKAKIYLMQSTGLKDKNGVPIFEGDIVEYFHTPAVIQQVKGGFAIVNTSDYEYITNLNGHMRILGNIWEHPELLEGVN